MGLDTIWVVFHAWKRPVLTEQTVGSFLDHNDDPRIKLRYALDGGYDSETKAVLESFEVEPVAIADTHVGIAEVLSRATQTVAAKGSVADVVTVIQNDWECVRPLPLGEIEHLLSVPDIGWMRLFGRYKGKGQTEEADERLFGYDRSKTATWEGKMKGTDAYVGRYLWGHPPVIARVPLAAYLAGGAEDNREATRRSLLFDLRCAAYLDNPVFYHIGGGQSAREMGGHV